MLRILFVCTGNTCRSPLAEGLFRNMMQTERVDVEVRSAGVSAIGGGPISRHSAALLLEAGFQEQLSSSALSQEDVDWSDLILTMTMNHKGIVIQRYPQAIEKSYTLKEFVEDDPLVRAAIEERERLAAELQMKHALSEPITADERKRFDQLEDSLPDFDITDPFGGSIEAYRMTAKEIEDSLKKLLSKIQGYQSDERDR
jgi:protein-tyrosine-phosphatase